MTNNGTAKYEFDVYRKDAITNVQVKPRSCHNPRILQGIFKGFVHCAMIICSDKYIKNELAFLKNIFVENGYKENVIRKIIEEATSKSTQQITKKTSSDCIDTEQKQTISLPWIPGALGLGLGLGLATWHIADVTCRRIVYAFISKHVSCRWKLPTYVRGQGSNLTLKNVDFLLCILLLTK